MVVQLIVFSALGWLLAGILDGVGALRRGDALFVSGLGLALVAGVLFLDANSAAFPLRIYRSRAASLSGDTGAWSGVPLSRALALAVVSAAAAAAGLIVAAALIR